MTTRQMFEDQLNGYANSGELDSGVESLKESLGQLEKEGVSSIEQISQLLDELIAARSSSAVKQKANAILELL